MKKILNILFLFLTSIFPFAIVSQAENPIVYIDDNFEMVSVTEWLVAGVFPSEYYPANSKDVSLRDGYSKDFLKELGGETKAKIEEGTSVLLGTGNQVKFDHKKWDKEYIDLIDIFGESANVCAYLYTEIESKNSQEVFFHVGINDAGKVWINGNLIVENPFDGTAERSEEIVKVQLNKGRNTVLFKIDQAGGGWGAYFQIYSKTAHETYLKENIKVDFGKDFDDPKSIATHVETKVLCKQENRYIGWPTIAKTKSGELLAVFSGDRDQHVCPYGIVQMIRSKDNGVTWSEPETVNNTPLDDRDAGIIETKDGILVVSWFTSLAFDNERYFRNNPAWERHAGKLSQETREKWLGNWTRRSLDNGKTWEDPVKQNGTAPHGPIELADGRLLYVGTGKIEGEKVNSVEESKDGGKSWQMLSTIAIPENEDIKYYHEPHVVELPNGKLVAQIRYQPEKKMNSYLRQSESYDGGKTWAIAHETPMWGYPPHLIVLDNGWLLSVYGVRRKPYSERACISKDGGKTWEIKNEIILKHSMNSDLGYPASVQLDDGTILTIYYEIDKKGEKTCLMGTKWRLK
jgi:sialidase-1